MLNNTRLKHSEVLVKTAMKLLKFTCQFYVFKKNTTEIPQLNGCGILIELNKNFYILSNAHVLADQNLGQTFLLLGDGNTLTIGGEYVYTKPPLNGNIVDDKFDIVVVKIDDLVVNELKKIGYDFWEIDNVNTGYNPKETDDVLVVGFPGSQLKLDSSAKKVTAKPFIFKTKLLPKKSYRTPFTENTHIFAKYSINKVVDVKTSRVKRGPKPHGLSGSGLWLLQKQNEFEYKCHLISILFEYDETKAMLLSTKINLFIEAIKQKFDS